MNVVKFPSQYCNFNYLTAIYFFNTLSRSEEESLVMNVVEFPSQYCNFIYSVARHFELDGWNSWQVLNYMGGFTKHMKDVHMKDVYVVMHHIVHQKR